MTPEDAFPPSRIEVLGLACRRGERLLFEGLDFAVAPGELLLLRGPNGTGKTTLLMTLAGLFRPDAGTMVLEGGPEGVSPVHLLGHLSAIKGRLSVRENLAFWADMQGGAHERVSAALETVGLGHIGHLDAGYLSAGQTRRLALARLLASARPIWLLDEPTSALDAEGEQLVGDLIAAHLERGGLAVAATHHDIAVGVRPVRTLMVGHS